MNILFLRGFNNYFNRIVKKYSTLEDYRTDSSSYVEFGNINFNPNDGVATELIIGGPNQIESNKPLDWENIGTPDYCICYENTTAGDPPVTTSSIISRWFVLESERTRTGQYRLALKRDVLAEHYNDYMNAPCFIEKGIITDKSNSLLYNNENMTYNQIKTNEYLLKDSTESAWIVGYVAKNSPTENKNISTTIIAEGTPNEYYDAEDLPFNFNGSAQTNYSYLKNIGFFSGAGYALTKGLGWNNKVAGNIIHNLIVDSYGNISSSYSPLSIIHEQDTYNPSSSVRDILESATNRNSSNNVIPYYYNNLLNINRLSAGEAVRLFSSGDYTSYISFYNNNNDTDANCRLFPILYCYTNIYDSYRGEFPSDWSTSRAVGPAPFGVAYGLLYYNVVKQFEKIHTSSEIIEPTQYDNKIVKYNNKFYIMHIDYDTTNFSLYSNIDRANNLKNTVVTGNCTYEYCDTDTANIRTSLNVLSNNLFSYVINRSGISEVFPRIGTNLGWSEQAKYIVTLEPLETETLETTISNYSNRNSTYDSPCDLFIIPYGRINCTKEITTDNSTVLVSFTTDKNEGLGIARAIATALGENACYDIQITPYCPSEIIRNNFLTSSTFSLDSLDPSIYSTVSKTTGGVTSLCSFVAWVSSCKGEFDININIPVSDFSMSDSLNYKISNETQLCRLASPNFNGMFEFGLAKNDGITKFNVDYTYKPYTPYIHINPDFKGLYGPRWNENGDWNDARGLICGGDFSLSFINSYWQTYQNNNKNYQQIFDRQIQNMDINNAIAIEKQQLTGILGTINAGISGAASGGAMGATAGPYGAIAGAILGAGAGAATSAIAAAKDMEWLERQQEENRSYAIDMYGYQLGNIQAMPYSLARTEALTNNNKIWPILEIYNATDNEIEALKLKIQYNGMTIMKIGKLSDYSISPDFDNVFLKGQLIKLNSLDDDFHIADAIYNEVNKGFYIPQGGNL